MCAVPQQYEIFLMASPHQITRQYENTYLVADRGGGSGGGGQPSKEGAAVVAMRGTVPEAPRPAGGRSCPGQWATAAADG
jgi:hypothetical protein